MSRYIKKPDNKTFFFKKKQKINYPFFQKWATVKKEINEKSLYKWPEIWFIIFSIT